MSKLNEAIEVVLENQQKYVEYCGNENADWDMEIALKENLLKAIDNLKAEYEEYKANKKEKVFEETRAGQLYELLKENKKGITREQILEKMNISKGNFGSIMVYLRRAGYEAIKIGGKYFLSEYVTIAE